MFSVVVCLCWFPFALLVFIFFDWLGFRSTSGTPVRLVPWRCFASVSGRGHHWPQQRFQPPLAAGLCAGAGAAGAGSTAGELRGFKRKGGLEV